VKSGHSLCSSVGRGDLILNVSDEARAEEAQVDATLGAAHVFAEGT
jgi:hypothetical protein